MYNSEYRRVKRILDKHNGNAAKVRAELGFDVPTRAKRQRKSNPANGSTTTKDTTSIGHGEASTADDAREEDISGNSGRSNSEAPVTGTFDFPEAPVSGTSANAGLFTITVISNGKKLNQLLFLLG